MVWSGRDASGWGLMVAERVRSGKPTLPRQCVGLLAEAHGSGVLGPSTPLRLNLDSEYRPTRSPL